MKPGKRIAIVGVTGSGKTTLASRLSGQLCIPRVELDTLYWKAGWLPVPLEVFRQRVDAALAPAPLGAWIVDGNYRQVRDIVWGRADTLIWLDYTLPLALARLMRRTLGRIIRQEELYNGNTESIRNTFFSRDSIILYLFQSHNRFRATYPGLLALPEYRHLAVIRLKNPRETEEWVGSGLRQLGQGRRYIRIK
jgi:adenylate kinase family enzyme